MPGKIFLQSITALTFALLFLANCGPQPSPPQEIAEQVERLATQTQAARQTLEVEGTSRVPTLTPPRPTASLTPEPQAETVSPEVLERAGPFRQVSSAEALIAGRVQQLEVRGDEIWLLSEHGFSLYENGSWQGYLADSMGQVIGQDRQGRFWVATEDGSQIAAWDWETWQVYTTTLGWEPVQTAFGAPVRPRLYQEGNDNLWVATAADVRRFDGEQWHVFTDSDLNMPPVSDPEISREYTLLIDPDGEGVYTGRCDWGGPGPVDGGGLSLFSRDAWERPEPDLGSGCVSALSSGPQGDVWVGLESGLWHLATATGSWEKIPLPDVPEGYTRFGYFVSLTLAPDGNPWPLLALCGGASCYSGEVLYTRKDGTWHQIGDISTGQSSRLLFSGEGTAWLTYGAGIARITAQSGTFLLEPAAEFNVLTAASDENGRLWLIAEGAGAPTLWTLGELPE